MSFQEQLDQALSEGIEIIKESKFFQDIANGKNAKEYYVEYLKAAYHYVTNSSSFTPLAARRMDSKHLKVRKWILEHSGEEMGHELMALKDLEKFGCDRNEIINSIPNVGVTAWVSFFHYKVAIANPFCAFGVLYFLEGMATELAPIVVKNIVSVLNDDEKKAITFFREHGDLDEDHLQEQKEILAKADLSDDDKREILQTIKESAAMKKFMLDQIVK
ncbi:iron-containing redox enzyme family protein [Bacteriovorax sp. Seq25_V]|uniref:iron-containing redox enzyme family protein n=1 Tax=Bacteriovorax sp. Seq25_V TaxID=1201288 RepID=UPI00038A0D74|nr:iron-containing redox enzyme family protein [Bacteriovorax sp. Seq25_V]EQC47707.1 TENA/THI-4 domain protein [Bacteriovorax sp. Seq25_V]